MPIQTPPRDTPTAGGPVAPPGAAGIAALETEDGKARGILPKCCPDGFISRVLFGPGLCDR